jgi:hypothetical protein
MRFFLTVLLAVWPLMAQTEDASQPHPVGKLVDISGRKLHLNCIGQGTPVVILVHGTGASRLIGVLFSRKSALLPGCAVMIVQAMPGVTQLPRRKHTVKCPTTCTR